MVRMQPSLPSPRRAACLVGVLVASTGTLAACGSSSSSSTNAAGAAGAQTAPGAGGAQAGRGGFSALASDPKVVACLKKAGVALPTGGGRPGGGQGGGGQGGGGVPPGGGTGTAPNGRPQGGGAGGQFQKIRDALQKCGIQLPARPGGAQGTPPSGTATTPGQS
jgi:hypothetical protein